MTEARALPVLSAADMEGNPARLIDPASVRPSINRGPSGPVRNTLFRGKLVNQLALRHSLMLLAPLLSVCLSLQPRGQRLRPVFCLHLSFRCIFPSLHHVIYCVSRSSLIISPCYFKALESWCFSSGSCRPGVKRLNSQEVQKKKNPPFLLISVQFVLSSQMGNLISSQRHEIEYKKKKRSTQE